MRKFLLTLGAVVMALSLSMSAQRADAQPVPGIFEVSTSSFGKFNVSFFDGNYSTFLGFLTANMHTQPWFPTFGQSLELAQGFLNQYVIPGAAETPVGDTNGIPAENVGLVGSAYTFAYAATDTGVDPLSTVAGVSALYNSSLTPETGNGVAVATFDNDAESIAQVDFNDLTQSPVNEAEYNLLFAYVPKGFEQTPVPEIDGPVMVQVGFALAGLYVLMLGRRRREDEGDFI